VNFHDGLDLEGVNCNVMLGDDKPKEASNSDVEHALEGIQADGVLTTPFEYDS
jgi:hypothetical protein